MSLLNVSWNSILQIFKVLVTDHCGQQTAVETFFKHFHPFNRFTFTKLRQKLTPHDPVREHNQHGASEGRSASMIHSLITLVRLQPKKYPPTNASETDQNYYQFYFHKRIQFFYCSVISNYCVRPNFFSSPGSSFRSESAGRAGRCRASRSGANLRPDFPVPARPSGSLAFTAWRQTVLAMVCSPSRARFTSRPAAFNSSTRSSTNRRASGGLDERRQGIQQERALAKFAQARRRAA